MPDSTPNWRKGRIGYGIYELLLSWWRHRVSFVISLGITFASLTLYYFKNELEQDPTVKVSAILEMNKELGTPDSLKLAVPVPNAGAHVLGSYLTSKDVKTVQREIEKFAIDKLHLRKIN